MVSAIFDDQLSKAQTDELIGQARKATDLLKALSHETRLVILCLLCEGEKSVSEIEAILKLPQASISQQLARLRADNLVSTRREGRLVHYRIANSEVAPIVETLYELFCKPAGTHKK